MPQYDSMASASGGGRVPLVHKTEEEKIPLFLVKLWNIVEDPNYASVIGWDETGYSFHITDPYTFCKNVLPQYFKHNNLNSLIRQLNMYGFRKITPIDRSGLTRADSDHEHLEFSHPYFVRDHPELLNNIRRKATTQGRVMPADASSVTLQSKELSRVLDEVRQLRERQSSMESKMAQLMKENQSLWQDVSHMRSMHMKQQQVVNKLVQFLIALVQPSGQKRLGKRQLLAIGPDEIAQSAKRLRQNVGGNFSGGILSADMLDRLQRELLDQTEQSAHGPIIADVTDDPEHNNGSQQQQQQQLIGENVTLGSREPPLTPGPFVQPGSAASSRPSTVNDWNSQRASLSTPSPFNVDIGDVLGSGATNNAINYYPPNSRYNPVSAQPNVTVPTSLQMAPNLDRQLSHEVLNDYLSGVDQSIENCRDMLATGGLQIDPDIMKELFSMCEQAPLELETPVHEADPTAAFASPPRAVGSEVAVYQRPQFVLPPVDTFNTTAAASHTAEPSYTFVDSPIYSAAEPLTPNSTAAGPSTQPAIELLTPNTSPVPSPVSAPLKGRPQPTRSLKGKRKN
uniref:HSF-type DNA-binding domain-containing protein n=1 Tax=Plectus sambesii TaxID=2011161 RepID=A0A914WGC3_9BILA